MLNRSSVAVNRQIEFEIQRPVMGLECALSRKAAEPFSTNRQRPAHIPGNACNGLVLIGFDQAVKIAPCQSKP